MRVHLTDPLPQTGPIRVRFVVGDRTYDAETTAHPDEFLEIRGVSRGGVVAGWNPEWKYK